MACASQRAYLTNTYTTAWTRTTVELVRGLMCSRKNEPYHNVARQPPLIFSIFLHQISCRRVQSIFETTLTSTTSEAYPTMPCISLVLFACASSGQSYNIGFPVAPNIYDVIDTMMTGDPMRSEVFWTFVEKYYFDRSRFLVCLSLPYLRVSGKNLKN